MGVSTLSLRELPVELREHSLIIARKSNFPHVRPTVDGEGLSDDLFEIFEKIPPSQAKILVDLGGLEQFDTKAFNALRTSLGMAQEIVLTGVCLRIKNTLGDLNMIRSESNPNGFKLVDLPIVGSTAKET